MKWAIVLVSNIEELEKDYWRICSRILAENLIECKLQTLTNIQHTFSYTAPSLNEVFSGDKSKRGTNT